MQVSLFQFGGGISNKTAIEGIVECIKLGMSVLSKITNGKPMQAYNIFKAYILGRHSHVAAGAVSL